ncbi:hypothetical protein D3C86_1950480 [compost metagenome]
MVAQHRVDAACAGHRQRMHIAQRGQRIRPPVDQVAGEQDRRRLLFLRQDAVDQRDSLIVAALQVADHIGFHSVVIEEIS